MLVGMWHLSGMCLVFILLLQELRFSTQLRGNRDAEPVVFLGRFSVYKVTAVGMEWAPSTVTLLVMESVLSQMFESIAVPSELLFPTTV